MMRRREFIGTLGGVCFSIGVAAPVWARPEDPLDWQCDVIDTQPHGPQNRSPVVTGVSLQPGGDQLAVVGDDHFISIYDLKQRRFTKDLRAHQDWVQAARFSGDGQTLATAGNDRRLLLWNTNDWNQTPDKILHDEAIFDLAFSHDSKRIATVGFDQSLRIFDVASRQPVEQLDCRTRDIRAVAFSPDDRYLVAGGRSGELLIWNLAQSKTATRIEAHRRRIRSLTINQAGRIISCGDDQLIKVTVLNQPTQQRTLPRHGAKLYALAALPGNVLATGGSDNQIHLWRLSGTESLGTLHGHTGTVSCLDFQNGRLVSGSFDTQVRVWNIKRDFVASLRNAKPSGRWSGKLK